ncbi:rho GTPase-activating protein SYDE1-like isoform X4 [Nerophis ophidion]|uniref:rho GTPase-activating protein SYDE1-like isoform X4 n=1 Tax=Nerophis ophidion TaxID=159077 RepID=UPI002AE038B9|nr:rho GTPase-activating protein SYDE1-like isoform X4 [Nerophis ophidion]
MAQPLLKRTLSRLRGKNKSRRKTERQVHDVPLQSDGIQKPGTCGPAMTGADCDLPVLHRVTSEKPLWVWPVSEAPPTSLLSNDGERRSFCTLGQNAAQRQTQDKEFFQAAASSVDPNMAVRTKLSGQRAYLQSLDRSSRDWVLSSGKSEASDKACRRNQESGRNIWYNPIPEEEDIAGLPRNEDVWTKMDGKPAEPERLGPVATTIDRGLMWTGSAQACRDLPSLDATNPHVEDSSEEGADSKYVFQKKAGVVDRLGSPGTVRKLSFKMKKLPELRRRISLRSSRVRQDGDKVTMKKLADQNVISRYHLDSSTPPALPQRRLSRGRSASKGGYLSDGDSPELLPRQPGDKTSFQLYTDSEPSSGCQRLTGLLTVHLLGLEHIKSKRCRESKEMFLAIQIDGITLARTAPLTLQGHALSLNHTFHLELEGAWQLRVVVLTSAASTPPGLNQTRTRICCLGTVALLPLFKAGSGSQQLCVNLEPQGRLYIKLSLQEPWDVQLDRTSTAPSKVFGVELRHLVEEEGSASAVPLIILKTVAEIERRGLKVVGLYRLCGSAAGKKELRDWFERNASAVCLGVLKDYLRELPSPLITSTLYEVVKEAMTLRPPPTSPDLQLAHNTVALLSCLPAPERATLSHLLDHLSLVANFSASNRMTAQNLAVCFGPVLLKQEAWKGGMKCQGQDLVDFKLHIEALHYLLQLWPGEMWVGGLFILKATWMFSSSVPAKQVPADNSQDLPPPAVLHPGPEDVVVSRRGPRLDSPPPINRYAGDWSVCGQDGVSAQDADYDEVAGSESDEGGERQEERVEEHAAWFPTGSGALFEEDVLDFDAPFSCRLSLKDFDSLIHDLDRELAKQIHICL